MPCNIYGAMDNTNMFLLGCVTKRVCSTQSQSENKPQEDTFSEFELKEKSQIETHQVEEEEMKVYAVLDYCPDDGVSYFFNFSIGEEKITMDRHVPIHMDTKSPDCNVLVQDGVCISGAVDGSLVVWDVAKHEVLANMVDPALVKAVRVGGLRYASSTGQPAHDGMITCVSLTPSKKYLVSGGVDMQARVWDVAKRELLTVLTGHTDVVSISMDLNIFYALFDLI